MGVDRNCTRFLLKGLFKTVPRTITGIAICTRCVSTRRRELCCLFLVHLSFNLQRFYSKSESGSGKGYRNHSRSDSPSGKR